MKKTALWILLIMIATFGVAQEEDQDREIETLLGDEITFTGFGGPWMNFTSINGSFTHMMGGGGGVILNQVFYFGGYGYGNTNAIDYDLGQLDFGYGGIMAGYIHQGNKAIHPTVGLMMGWGEVKLRDSNLKDNVFVLHPMAEVEMNITRFFKTGIGAGYRYVTGIGSFPGLNDRNREATRKDHQ